MKRSLEAAALIGCCLWFAAACRTTDDLTSSSSEESDPNQVVPIANSVEADDYTLDASGGTVITLNGGSISAGDGVTVDGTVATITRAGTFTIRGTLADGQLKVNAGKDAKVKLILDGVNITTSDDAPIFVKNASKAVIYLAPGSTNTLTDGAASTRDGAIHCKTRLSIFGPGRLVVSGNVDDGIHAKGGIVIEEGTFEVHSLVSGIKSKINVTINGGTYAIRAGNDGVHAETDLAINGGTVDVLEAYEGLEGATITMAGGTVHLATSDDGVNASSGTGDVMGAPGAGGPGGMMGGGTGTNPFYMRGGYLYVNANGDGLDIGGPIETSDGVVIVDGPTANDSGALDYSGSFNLTGGTLIAVGSAGMAQMPSQGSTVNSVMIRFSSAQQAGALFRIQDATGADVVTFRPAKRYQSVVVGTSSLKKASGYSLYLGGNSSGAEKDGLYSGGVYSGGTSKGSFDVTSVTTSLVSY